MPLENASRSGENGTYPHRANVGSIKCGCVRGVVERTTAAIIDARRSSSNAKRPPDCGRAVSIVCAAAICCKGVMLQITTPGISGHGPIWSVIRESIPMCEAPKKAPKTDATTTMDKTAFMIPFCANIGKD